MSDSARRVLSVAFASQCSDLTSPLSLPSCIQNQTLKRCSFLTRSLKKMKRKKKKMWEYEPSHWPCREISLARMKLSFCNAGLWENPSKTLPCLIVTSEYTMPFQISWPNCASSYTARHLESQKEIFTVIQITPLFCFIKKKNASEKERSAFHLPEATTGHDENAVLFTNGTI